VNDIEIACLRLRCEEAELELTKVEQQRDAAVADAQIVALLERLLPSSGFELHLLHSVVERGPDAWRVARWNVGPVEIATGWSLLEALQALGAEETT
jgi:hypothetical protein